MKRKKWGIVLRWAFMLGMMILIFHFSAQTGVQSSQSSGFFVKKLFELFRLNHLSPQVQRLLRALFTFVIRKAAHMSEYALLGVSIYLVMDSYRIRHGGRWAWLCSVAYAATDEMHQLFVSERSGSFVDVMIDGTGALIGIGLMILIVQWIRNRREKNALSEG